MDYGGDRPHRLDPEHPPATACAVEDRLFRFDRDGRVLASLPEQRAPQAMDGARRMVFMKELARADAELGKDRFRVMLEQGRGRCEGQAPERVR